MNDVVSQQKPAIDPDDAWDPEGPLGHDAKYAKVLDDPETERVIDAAVGLQRTLRRLSRKLQQ
jgi:hypothetical protein